MSLFGRGIRVYGKWGASNPFVPTLPTADLSLSPASAAEGNSGTNTRTVTVTLSAPAGVGGASVDWTGSGIGLSPAPASAFQGAVYPSGTITIAEGGDSGTGTVTIVGNTTPDVDRTFRITLSNPSGCVLGLATVDGTIANDDDALAAFAEDTTVTTDRTASWHADTTIRTASHMVAGYSKTGGRFGIAEFSPTDGTPIAESARIILNEPSLYTAINDHFMVIPWRIQNGSHAGKLWAVTLPHGPGTATNGSRRFYCRVSTTGRTKDLAPAGTGVDYLDAGGTHNYGQVQERSDGRIAVLTINDAGSPQFARFFWTDDPAVIPTLGRNVFAMTGIPSGGSPQLYVNAAPSLTANRMVVYGFLHPTVPDAPIKRFVVDLSAGTVISNGSTVGSGSIYDTSGATMLAFGDAPSIHVPTGGLSTRVHDVCQYGTYAGGFAVLISQGVNSTALGTYSHYVLWCPPASNPDVESNWTRSAVGSGQARMWDTGSRYMSDVRFLPPRDSEGIRIAKIAYSASGYRTEVWAGTTPDSLSLVTATAWATDPPRPTRLYINPGGEDDTLVGFVYGFTTYSGFTNFTPSTPQILLDNPNPTLAEDLTITGTLTVGASSPITITSATPGSTLTVQSGELPAGMTLNSVDRTITGTPTTAGSGSAVIRETRAGSPNSPQDTTWNWTVTGFSWASLADDFLILDPADAVVDSGAVSELASTTADGGTATVWSQATAGNRPDYVAGPPARMDFVPGSFDRLTGDTAARDFTRNRKAVMMIARVSFDVATPSSNRVAINISNSAGAGTARLLIRQSTAGNIQSIARTGLESASLATGPTVTAGTSYVVAVVLTARGADDGGSTHRLYVGGTTYTPASEPGNASVIQDTQSVEAQIGCVASGTTPNDGKVGPIVIAAKNSGEFSAGEIEAAIDQFTADYPEW